MRPLLPVLLVVSACSVGPGGSFPNGSSATTVAMTASSTATTAETGDVEETTDASGDQQESSSGTVDPSDDSTSDTPADSSSASSDDDTSMTDPGSSSDDTASGTPLDPDLDIPDEGEQCDYPGDLQSCPGIAVCRFATAEYGICESCDACGNLFAPCVEGTDCDILFSCYAGSCTNFCTLGTFECGPVEDCLDIGHPTRGVCDPFA